MSTESHTPGPWTARYENSCWHIETRRADYCEYLVARVPNISDRPTNAANAALICAAPELKEAVIGARACLEMAMNALERTTYPVQQKEKYEAMRKSRDECAAVLDKIFSERQL